MESEPTPSDRDVLTGMVERVTHQNAENGSSGLRLVGDHAVFRARGTGRGDRGDEPAGRMDPRRGGARGQGGITSDNIELSEPNCPGWADIRLRCPARTFSILRPPSLRRRPLSPSKLTFPARISSSGRLRVGKAILHGGTGSPLHPCTHPLTSVRIASVLQSHP